MYFKQNVPLIHILIKKSMNQTLDYLDWEKLVYEKYSLTIDDIVKLKPNQLIKVLSMDRNVWDLALNDKNKGKTCKPVDFFKDNWAIYLHESDLHGKFLLFPGECSEDISLIDINEILSSPIPVPKFEFHIEYLEHYYYPLKNEYLPAVDPQGFFEFTWPKNQKQHWTNFPRTTRVGYRGYFVLWSKLNDLPNITW